MRIARKVLRPLLAALALVSLLSGVLLAGQRYLFCAMMDEAVDRCCCTHDGPAARGEAQAMKKCCCAENEHASPGIAVTEPKTPDAFAAQAVLGGSLPALQRQPIDPLYRRDSWLPDWNGPPRRERRAHLQVFLL